MRPTEPRKTCTPKSRSASLELSFERFSQPIAFRELSNSPPLTRSCQEGSDAISLNSASYAGPAIASCDGSRIHGDADRGDLDCAENEMSSHLLCGPLSSRCLKATRSDCSAVIFVFGLSLVIQAATQNSTARKTDRQDTRDHNGWSEGRLADGVQASPPRVSAPPRTKSETKVAAAAIPSLRISLLA
jgi:hypothetical protein